LNAENDDIRLDELFRKKLESAEVMPNPSFNSTLMKTVARREFMTFNPAKINVFYVGGAIMASIAALLVLSLNKTEIPADSQFNLTQENIVITENTDTTANQLPDVIGIPDESIQPKTNVAARTPASVNKTSPAINNAETDIENNQPVLTERFTLDPAVTRSEIINREQLIDNRLVGNNRNNARLFIPSAINGCAPFSVTFAVTSEEIDSCRWSFGGNGFSSEKTPVWIFTSSGNYQVSLEAFSSGKLIGVYSENITVHPKPIARFEISPDHAIIPDDMVRFINYSSGAVRYQWDFGDGSGSQQFEPLYRYKRYDNYTVTLKAYNEYGCADSVLLHNAFADSECYIEFPNAFIPNRNGPSGGVYSQKSDESLQVFHPVFFGVIDYNLKIFSRRGIQIFESTDINIGWDGYFNGQLSEPGVYVWQVSGKYRTGESFFKRGDVTLIKN
jgi:PKD repeat protein